MKNLGKIIFILFLIQSEIYAGVKASVDGKEVQRGDMVTYSLELSGEDIQRPNINNLCGEDVISTSSSTSIQSVNGEYKKKYILSYKFIPKKDCTIEHVEVNVDGKIEKTLPIDIAVKKVISSTKDKFSLRLYTEKKDVFVGEPFEVILILKQKKSVKVVDNKYNEPSFKGFWVKGTPTQEQDEDGEYIITRVVYTIAAQRVGKLNIASAQMKIASRSNAKNYFGGFFPQVKWKSYFSNELEVNSMPIPHGVSLVGDFNIEATVKNTTINAGEAVNLTVKLTGDGNLEDVKSFKPYIEGVSVFDEKIVIENNVLTQKITFVADSDFVIEPFLLKVFNTKTKTIKTISTNKIDIKVKNAKPKEELKIKRDETPVKVYEKTAQKEFDKFWLLMAFLIGLVGGILIMIIKSIDFSRKNKKINLKDHKVLLVKLMPYKDNEDVKTIVEILENNRYSDKSKEIDKKGLKEIIKKYEIS